MGEKQVLASIFAQFNRAGKADLSKGCWDPKRKLVVTTHFSFKLKFGKRNAYFVLYFDYGYVS